MLKRRLRDWILFFIKFKVLSKKLSNYPPRAGGGAGGGDAALSGEWWDGRGVRWDVDGGTVRAAGHEYRALAKTSVGKLQVAGEYK